MPTELEVKLSIPDHPTAEKLINDTLIIDQMDGPLVTKNMLSIYYDTPRNFLSALRWSLRLRDEGGTFIANMKTSSLDDTGYMFKRNEWQVQCNDIRSAIPLLIEAGAPEQLAEITGEDRLEERCRIEFVRQTAVLKMHDNVVELDLDSGTIYAGENTQDFLHLELELLYGSQDALLPLSTLLSQKYGLHRETLSKYEMALRLMRE